MYFSGYAIEKSKLDGSERQTIHQEKESYILCLSIGIWSYSKNNIGV